eukprot:1898418-Prymnesium_polylepis.1
MTGLLCVCAQCVTAGKTAEPWVGRSQPSSGWNGVSWQSDSAAERNVSSARRPCRAAMSTDSAKLISLESLVFRQQARLDALERLVEQQQQQIDQLRAQQAGGAASISTRGSCTRTSGSFPVGGLQCAPAPLDYTASAMCDSMQGLLTTYEQKLRASEARDSEGSGGPHGSSPRASPPSRSPP